MIATSYTLRASAASRHPPTSLAGQVWVTSGEAALWSPGVATRTTPPEALEGYAHKIRAGHRRLARAIAKGEDPGRVDEALALLQQGGEDARPLAGGQSLVPMMNFRIARPSFLVDLNGCADLAFISTDREGLHIGAMTRQRDAELDAVVPYEDPEHKLFRILQTIGQDHPNRRFILARVLPEWLQHPELIRERLLNGR